jgi:hypothetical protein
MLMSFLDLKEPWCHRLRLFGNLGVYQGMVSSFGLLYLGGWEHETDCTLLMLMLAANCVFYQDHEESYNHLFFACSWTSLLWPKVKSWLRLCRGMATISSVVRGLNLKGKNTVARMKRVSLSIVVYLIWEERNIRVFENSCTLVESLFWRFQVLFYMILHFHECNHLQINVSWLYWFQENLENPNNQTPAPIKNCNFSHQ